MKSDNDLISASLENHLHSLSYYSMMKKGNKKNCGFPQFQSLLEAVQQVVALAFEEGLRFRFGGREHRNGGAASAVEGNIEIADHDVGILQVRKDMVQGTGLIGFHVHRQHQVHPALVAFFFQGLPGFFRFVHNKTDNAEFRAVRGQHGVNIDVVLSQNGGHFA